MSASPDFLSPPARPAQWLASALRAAWRRYGVLLLALILLAAVVGTMLLLLLLFDPSTGAAGGCGGV